MHPQKLRKDLSNIILVVLLAIIALLLIRLHPGISLGWVHTFTLEKIIRSAGVWGPLVLISLHIIQSVAFFLPGPFVSVAGGYLFGAFWGFVYNLIGTMAGTSILFWLARKLGKSIITQKINPREMKLINDFIARKGKYALIYARLIPFFPGDLLTILVSWTEIPYTTFFLFTLIGSVPRLIFENVFGSQLRHGTVNPYFVGIALLATLLLTGYLFSDRLKALFRRKAN
jgi:uncharacterized membrane protein YdjX (TVP38/TMEM64 family)